NETQQDVHSVFSFYIVAIVLLILQIKRVTVVIRTVNIFGRICLLTCPTRDFARPTHLRKHGEVKYLPVLDKSVVGRVPTF
ncbi:unnamed protein product, partial [Tenebrio molitor]